MKEQIKTVYTCEHCKKRYFVKHACIRHELYCASNPINYPKCNGCAHFEERKKDIWYDSYDGGYERETKSFYCKKRECGMYPIKVLQKDLVNKYPETFEGEILMPSECDLYTDDNANQLPF